MNKGLRWRDHLGHLNALTGRQFDELIADHELMWEGARIYYAFDPFELMNFCFPLSPGTDQPIWRRESPEGLVNTQISLSQLFLYYRPRPVLLPEYRTEVEGILAFLRAMGHRVYEARDILTMMMSESGLDASALTFDDAGELDDIIEGQFSAIIAAAMGIYHLGVKRMSLVLREHVDFYTLGKKDPRLQKLLTSLPPTPLADRTFDFLESLERHAHLDRNEARRRRRANRIDATAIDRLTTLNSALESAYRRQELPHRHVVVLVSSAPHTRRLFRQAFLRDARPMIGERRLTMLRTPEQLFAQLVCQGTSQKRKTRVRQTRQKLEELRDLLAEVEHIGVAPEECHDQCLLRDGEGRNCKWYRICAKLAGVERVIHILQREHDNWGLAHKIRQFQLGSDRKIPGGGKQSLLVRRVLDVIRAVQEMPDLPSRAVERMVFYQHLIAGRSALPGLAPHIERLADVETQLNLVTGQDSVTAAVHHFPVDPQPVTPRYRELVAQLRQYLLLPVRQRTSGVKSVYDLFFAFVDFDEQGDSGQLADHELVRCLLFLAVPEPGTDALAVDHAIQMATAFPHAEQEFMYIATWGMRRLRNFSRADLHLAAARDKYPADPRFIHGFALNVFSWLSDPRKRRSCPYSADDVLESLELASVLYERTDQELELRSELVGSCFEGLAYVLAGGLPGVAIDLDRARQCLDEVKAWVPKATWRHRYPEYLFTEAMLEWAEHTRDLARGRSEQVLRHRLEHAFTDLSHAIETLPRPTYIRMQGKIQRELAKFT